MAIFSLFAARKFQSTEHYIFPQNVHETWGSKAESHSSKTALELSNFAFGQTNTYCMKGPTSERQTAGTTGEILKEPALCCQRADSNPNWPDKFVFIQIYPKSSSIYLMHWNIRAHFPKLATRCQISKEVKNTQKWLTFTRTPRIHLAKGGTW